MSSDVAYEKDQLWSVDGLGFPAQMYFTEATPGDTGQTHDIFYDGGNVEAEVQIPEAQNAETTLTAFYRANDHRSICLALRARLERREKIATTLKQLDVDADKSPIETIDTRRAFLKSIKFPNHNQNSTAKSQVVLTFTVPTQR